MHETSDAQLLRDYAECGAEAAFREIVARHTDLVYSAALRQVDSPDLASDLAQSVFTDLARKARSLTGKLAADASLVGWLYRSIRFAALNYLRDDRRRTAHERQAMEQLLTNSESARDWERIRPVLDEAMAGLSDDDRDALLLRYFKNQDFRAVGLALGVSDDAAQKRVSRAVERLREFFAKRGVTVGTGGLVVLISANAVQSAPIGLAATISTAAVLAGTVVHTSTIITATKIIAMTTLQKTLITATVAVLAGAGIYEARQAAQLRVQNQTLQQQQAPLAEQIRQLQAGNESLSNRLAKIGEAKKLSETQFNELLKLRGKIGQLQELNTRAAENDSREILLKSWLAREDQLKQFVQQYPNKSIPEFQLLSEQQWLDAAMNAKFDTDKDVQKELANLRHAAENNFASQAQSALSKYLKANDGQFPTDLSQLQQYFSSPVDDAILQRWKIAPASANPSVGVGDTIITEKSPVDATLDQRWAIGSNGFGAGNWESSDMGAAIAMMKPVMKAYAADHNGNQPTDPSQIQPYLTTPEQQAAFQKLMQKDRSNAASQ